MRFVLFLAAAALAAVPATARYTGACAVERVTEPVNGQRFRMRLPKGEEYAHPWERFPGEVFYDELHKCHVYNFQAVYDVDHNAHIDFVLPDHRYKALKQTCDGVEEVAAAMVHDHVPVCVAGGAETLAKQWRDSWVDDE